MSSPPRRLWLQWAFFAWAASTVLVVSLLVASHFLVMPVPTASRLASLSTHGEGWRVTHVLAKACGCSQRVLAHLLDRGAAAGFSETVLFIGTDATAENRLRAAGFDFEQVTAASLETRFGIQGAPRLMVVGPSNDILYSGGYSPSRAGPISDLRVLAEAQAGRRLEAMPTFGCAVNPALQKRVDPLSLKYP